MAIGLCWRTAEGHIQAFQRNSAQAPCCPASPEPRPPSDRWVIPCPWPLPEPKDWAHAGSCVSPKRRRWPQGSRVAGGRWLWGPGTVCTRVDAAAEKPAGMRGWSQTAVRQPPLAGQGCIWAGSEVRGVSRHVPGGTQGREKPGAHRISRSGRPQGWGAPATGGPPGQGFGRPRVGGVFVI